MNILILFNFSESSLNSLRFAIKLATDTKSKLKVLNEVDLTLPSYDISYYAGTSSFRRYEEMISEKFSDLLEEFPQVDDIEFVVEQGGLVEAANNIVEQDGIDLLIMGAGESKQITKTLFGNFTTEMIGVSKIPVLAIPKELREFEIKKICIAHDMDQDNVEDLAMARQFAVINGAKVHFLNIGEDPKQIDMDESLAALGLHNFFKEVEHEFHFLSADDVDKTIDSFVKVHEINMLVMRPGDHWLFGKLFSHTRKALAHQKIILLTIHK